MGRVVVFLDVELGAEQFLAAEAEPDSAVSVVFFQLSETVTVHGQAAFLVMDLILQGVSGLGIVGLAELPAQGFECFSRLLILSLFLFDEALASLLDRGDLPL